MGLQKVLDDVRELVEDEEGKASSHLPALIELLKSPDGLPGCRSELESLKKTLEPKGPRTDRVQALIWPLKEGDVRKTLDHLARFQHLLNLTLNVDQTYGHPVLTVTGEQC
jgi:hypothetical protein